jgi:hypothetical protein
MSRKPARTMTPVVATALSPPNVGTCNDGAAFPVLDGEGVGVSFPLLSLLSPSPLLTKLLNLLSVVKEAVIPVWLVQEEGVLGAGPSTKRTAEHYFKRKPRC